MAILLEARKLTLKSLSVRRQWKYADRHAEDEARSPDGRRHGSGRGTFDAHHVDYAPALLRKGRLTQNFP